MANDDFRLLTGKTAIITGGGRGIGAAAVKLFAAHGANVVLAELDAEPAEQIAAEVKAAGGTAVPVVGNITSDGAAETLVKAAVENFGGIDIIVNNAGYTWDGVAHKMTDEQWDAILKIHLTTPFRIIRAAAPYYRDVARKEKEETGQAQARKIVNVSSVSGTRGNSGQINYSAGKMGVVGLTKTLAKEWGQFNVQVNAVAYGRIETRLTSGKVPGNVTVQEGKEIQLGVPNQDPARLMMIPMQRGGTPDEAASVLLFFASPLSNYVSGQVLEVTGGS
jgi:3-oxoacyl-[acyl-carrier protein] reductase